MFAKSSYAGTLRQERRGPPAPRRLAIPTPPVTATRRELLALQQGLVARLEGEVAASVGGIPRGLAAYYAAYRWEVSSYEDVASLRELLDACADSDLVYLGDYHSLRASQATATRLVERLRELRTDVALAIEMVHSEDQAALDAYQAGALAEDAFLAAIRYRERWDFHWAPYRELLRVCRNLGVRVFGINVDPGRTTAKAMAERDRHAARLLVRETLAHPDRLIVVLDGDLHVASPHLPREVERQLARYGAQRARTIVHQNADPVFWRLAERGLERRASVVRLREGMYCVFSATPLGKLQSYQHWQESRAELWSERDALFGPSAALADDAPRPDDAEAAHQLVELMARFLGVDPRGLDGFSVFTPFDLDLLDVLDRDARVSPAVREDFRRHIAKGESYFVPKANIIYLADRSLDAAAEEAAHYLNCALAGFDDAPRAPRDAFYYRALREALGFFGSRLIDAKRPCLTEPALRELAARLKGRRLDAEGTRLRRLARLTLRHLEAERLDAHRRRLGHGGPRRAALIKQPEPLLTELVHTVGYLLGDKLHAAVLTGRMTRTEARALFADPLPPGRSEPLYLELVRRLSDVEHDAPERL